MILKCNNPACKNAYQDTKYGKGNRVFNPMKDNRAKCTVCGDVKTVKGEK